MATRDNANTTPAEKSTDAARMKAEADAAAEAAGKGRPTPTRKEREAARKRPLVPNDRRQAIIENREKVNAARERARIGMATGDERYLPQRDKGPQKRWVRDYVDARFSVGEILIPVMFIVIVLTFVPSVEAQSIAILGLWAFFMIAVIDSTIVGYIIQRKLAKKFGADRVEKVQWYAAMRSLQLRALRLPKPKVKRWQYPS